MKKILILCSLALSLMAFDASTATDKDNDLSNSTSMSSKKDMTISNTKSKDYSTSTSNQKTLAKSKQLQYEAQTKAIQQIAKLESEGVYPFSNCQLFTKPRQPSYFGLSCRSKKGYINSGKCDYLHESAKNYFSLDDALRSKQVEDIKGYATCGIYYGAVIAQFLKTEKLDYEIQDTIIKDALNEAEMALSDDVECSFNGAVSNVLCGNINITVGAVLNIDQYGVNLFSRKDFYGYSLSFSTNKSITNSVAKDKRTSKSSSNGNTRAKSLSYDSSQSSRISKKVSNSMSVGKFID